LAALKPSLVRPRFTQCLECFRATVASPPVVGPSEAWDAADHLLVHFARDVRDVVAMRQRTRILSGGESSSAAHYGFSGFSSGEALRPRVCLPVRQVVATSAQGQAMPFWLRRAKQRQRKPSIVPLFRGIRSPILKPWRRGRCVESNRYAMT
jgi:hypothetical protein